MCTRTSVGALQDSRCARGLCPQQRGLLPVTAANGRPRTHCTTTHCTTHLGRHERDRPGLRVLCRQGHGPEAGQTEVLHARASALIAYLCGCVYSTELDGT